MSKGSKAGAGGTAAPALAAPAATTRVTIKAGPGAKCTGNVRQPPAKIPKKRQDPKDWIYDLAPGDWLFNVDMTGIAGTTTSFTFTGAKATPPTDLTLPGQPGTFSSDNRNITFTVAAPGAPAGAP